MMGCPNWQHLLKIAEFYRPEWVKRRTTWKWILTIFKYKNESYKQCSGKSRWKNEVICLVFMFPSWVMTLNLSLKVHFLQLVLASARKLGLLAISIFHLKVFTTLLQKMIWFIGVLTTIYKILAIKISKNMLTQQKFNKTISFQTLISPKSVSHSIKNNYHFLKVQKETFQMHICKLL